MGREVSGKQWSRKHVNVWREKEGVQMAKALSLGVRCVCEYIYICDLHVVICFIRATKKKTSEIFKRSQRHWNCMCLHTRGWSACKAVRKLSSAKRRRSLSRASTRAMCVSTSCCLSLAAFCSSASTFSWKCCLIKRREKTRILESNINKRK